MEIAATSWALVVAALALFSYAAYRKESLTFQGILLANAIGLIAFYQLGWAAFLALVLFFALGETATRWARSISNNREHGVRGMGNIIGNAGIALVAALAGQPIAFFGSLGAALSDTLSSEIGQLSKKQPVMITTGEKAFRGTDGAITALGLGAGLLGAIIMAAITYWFNANINAFWIVLAAGMVGTLADSWLGATLQHRGWLDNNSVNLVATLVSAVFAGTLWFFIR